MSLLYPIWLLLFLPLLVTSQIWKLPSRVQQILRFAVITLIVLAMCGPMLRMKSKDGIVVVIADRSYSMPLSSDEDQKEIISLIESTKPVDCRVGVISFGRKAVVEFPPQKAKFTGFVHQVERDASDLGAAIELALAFIPGDCPARLLLLTDGKWTGKDPLAVASTSAATGIAIDYRLMQRSTAEDVAIAHLDVPEKIKSGQSLMINAWVQCPISQEINFELWRNGSATARGQVQRLAVGSKKATSGLTRLTFRDVASEVGTRSYTLKVVGTGKDPVMENNQAKFSIGIEGEKPILCLSDSGQSGLVELLNKGGIKVILARPNGQTWSLEELSGLSAIILENIPSQKIGDQGMANIAMWVKETGTGLMLTGGKNAYAAGGYFHSPLDPIMPVSMELRREHRKLSLAIMIALDRSGSMSATASGGKTKMDLANIASVQVLDLLTPMDEFGVIAVDTSSHIIAPLASVEKNRDARNDILRIRSEGGGIYVYEALSTSAQMLLSANSETRHIILFADAADAEEPDKYRELLKECRSANITVSVVGLGTNKDVHASLLEDIAKCGNGRCFFTDRPEELPRIFAQDTFVVARSTFVEEKTSVDCTPALISLSGRKFSRPPQIGGYNLCYLREGVHPSLVTTDQYRAPVIAAWQVGLGRVLCYTGEADGKYTGPIAKWEEIGDMFTCMAQWTAGKRQDLPGSMVLTQKLDHGICKVQLHRDPENDTIPFTSPPVLKILRSKPGSAKPEVENIPMSWTSPETLSAEISLAGDEIVLPTLNMGNLGLFPLSPTRLPYSPEFAPSDSNSGLSKLKHIGRATGGKEVLSPADIWKDMPRQPRFLRIGQWFLVAAVVLFLLEILERRSGLLTILFLARRQTVAVQKLSSPDRTSAPNRASPHKVAKSPAGESSKALSQGNVVSQSTAPSPIEREQGQGMLVALQRAKESVKERKP